VKPLLLSFELPILGLVTFPAYFSLLTIGFAFATLLTWREAKRLEIDPDRIVDLNLYMVIFGIIGSRILHVFADGHFMEYVNLCVAPEVVRAVGDVPAQCIADAQCGPYFLCNKAAGFCHPPRDCLLAIKIWRGGLTYYGGFMASIAFAFYYMRRHRLPIWRVSDLAAYAIPLGLFWGRMGCFLNGCCFGTVTKSVLGVVFLRGGATHRHQIETHLVDASSALPLPVHPTQLYSALLNLGIFFVCYLGIRPRKRFDGQVIWWFIVLKAITRSAVEILRDDERGGLGFLSTSQLVSLGFFALAVFMLRRLGAAADRVEARDAAAAASAEHTAAPSPPPAT
jgi:phosphatidylglycerol---prolipoprotein diacylglyceryl transferase